MSVDATGILLIGYGMSTATPFDDEVEMDYDGDYKWFFDDNPQYKPETTLDWYFGEPMGHRPSGLFGWYLLSDCNHSAIDVASDINVLLSR